MRKTIRISPSCVTVHFGVYHGSTKWTSGIDRKMLSKTWRTLWTGILRFFSFSFFFTFLLWGFQIKIFTKIVYIDLGRIVIKCTIDWCLCLYSIYVWHYHHHYYHCNVSPYYFCNVSSYSYCNVSYYYSSFLLLLLQCFFLLLLQFLIIIIAMFLFLLQYFLLLLQCFSYYYYCTIPYYYCTISYYSYCNVSSY